jgi:signal transduction histidine kinase
MAAKPTDRLHERIAELERRDARKTQLLANISHDLRTPLSAIITHAEILRDGIVGELTPKQLESVGGIIHGGQQLLAMVGEILTYARAASDQLTLALTEFEPGDAVAQVVTMNEPLAARKGLRLDLQVAPALPPIRADRDKFAHILGNLIGNAISFTEPGGRTWIDVSRACERGRDTLLVEVGDTGIGIPSAYLDYIFREFAQIDASASRAHHGTGLGLAIAHKMVSLHGGRIWVESEVDVGSRFFFTIPYGA